MLTKEDLDSLIQVIRKENEPIKQQLNELTQQMQTTKKDIVSMNEKLEKIMEAEEITRGALNSVLEWIDVYFKKDYPLPADKKKII